MGKTITRFVALLLAITLLVPVGPPQRLTLPSALGRYP